MISDSILAEAKHESHKVRVGDKVRSIVYKEDELTPSMIKDYGLDKYKQVRGKFEGEDMIVFKVNDDTQNVQK